MLINSTNLDKARLMDFYQVMNLTSGFLQKEDTAALNLTGVTGEFNIAFTDLDNSLKQARKTGLTGDVLDADDLRDNIQIGFLEVLNGYTRFPDKEIASAASRLVVVTDKYGPGIARLPQREESAALTNMVTDLRSGDNATLLQTTTLSIWVDKLDEANQAFNAVYEQRTEKEAALITSLTRTQRSNMKAAFEKLVQAIEANAFLNGPDAYKALADKINVEVANVQQAAKARATSAANAEKNKEEKVS